jgi:hypothetical protein
MERSLVLSFSVFRVLEESIHFLKITLLRWRTWSGINMEGLSFVMRFRLDLVVLEQSTGGINGEVLSQISSRWPRVSEMVFLLELWLLASIYLIRLSMYILIHLEEGIYNAE